MAISVIAVHPNQTIPRSLAVGGITILSGIVECLFTGNASGDVNRDTLTFDVGPVNLSIDPPIASCTMSLASFAYDGAVNNALWAIDSASVQGFVNVDRGSGTAHLEVAGNLAVRGPTGIILRINYIVFYSPS
jgi:hypothetical protein